MCWCECASVLVSWYHFVPSSLWEPAKEEYKDQYVHKISELWSTDGVVFKKAPSCVPSLVGGVGLASG